MEKYYEFKYIKYKKKYIDIKNNNLNGGAPSWFPSSLLSFSGKKQFESTTYFLKSYDKTNIDKIFTAFNNCNVKLDEIFELYTKHLEKISNKLIDDIKQNKIDTNNIQLKFKDIYPDFSKIIRIINDINKNGYEKISNPNVKPASIKDDNTTIILALIQTINKIFDNYLDNWKNNIFSDKLINIYKESLGPITPNYIEIVKYNNIQLGYLFYDIINKLLVFITPFVNAKTTEIKSIMAQCKEHINKSKIRYDKLYFNKQNYIFRQNTTNNNSNKYNLIKDFMILLIYIIKLYEIKKIPDSDKQAVYDRYINNNLNIIPTAFQISYFHGTFDENFDEIFNKTYSYLFNEINLNEQTRYDLILKEFDNFSKNPTKYNPKTKVTMPDSINEKNQLFFFLVKNNIISEKTTADLKQCDGMTQLNCTFENLTFEIITTIKDNFNSNVIKHSLFELPSLYLEKDIEAPSPPPSPLPSLPSPPSTSPELLPDLMRPPPSDTVEELS